MYRSRNLIRRQVILVDKQGEIKAKKSSMHPVVIFKQHFGLVIAAWVAFILFLMVFTDFNFFGLKKEYKAEVEEPYSEEEGRKVIRAYY